jgi:hypothetical protein
MTAINSLPQIQPALRISDSSAGVPSDFAGAREVSISTAAPRLATEQPARAAILGLCCGYLQTALQKVGPICICSEFGANPDTPYKWLSVNIQRPSR